MDMRLPALFFTMCVVVAAWLQEEEYLDEASDDNWGAGDGPDAAHPLAFEWETPAHAGGGAALSSRWTTMMQDGLFDDLPPFPGMRMGDFGRAPGRRLQAMRMGAAPAAAAGVWDDAGDGLDGLPDPMMAGVCLGGVVCSGCAVRRGSHTCGLICCLCVWRGTAPPDYCVF